MDGAASARGNVGGAFSGLDPLAKAPHSRTFPSFPFLALRIAYPELKVLKVLLDKSLTKITN